MRRDVCLSVVSEVRRIGGVDASLYAVVLLAAPPDTGGFHSNHATHRMRRKSSLLLFVTRETPHLLCVESLTVVIDLGAMNSRSMGFDKIPAMCVRRV